MNNEQTDEIYEAIQELPPDIQFALEEIAWRYVCQKIADDLNLYDSAKDSLELEVGLFLSGLSDIQEMVEHINISIDDDQNLLTKIKERISDDILSPYSEKIKENRVLINNQREAYKNEIDAINNELGKTPFVPKKIIAIPIKKKPNTEPTLTMKSSGEFNKTTAPSGYREKDPYHEDL